MSTTYDTQLLTELEHALAHPGCETPECGRDATHIVHVHQLDDCNREELTPDGALLMLLCEPCLAAKANSLTADIAKWLPKFERVACLTCWKPVAELHDLLETERIR
jgi:hypothetical protein